ncbi:hypothetical protein [Nocardia sp. CA-290969]|uniref:hypothetical protein n=1 Tax=Nocardia sp. CA-290969 TaxID=3239986 RepID=UPI003D9030CE
MSTPSGAHAGLSISSPPALDIRTRPESSGRARETPALRYGPAVERRPGAPGRGTAWTG